MWIEKLFIKWRNLLCEINHFAFAYFKYISLNRNEIKKLENFHFTDQWKVDKDKHVIGNQERQKRRNEICKIIHFNKSTWVHSELNILLKLVYFVPT